MPIKNIKSVGQLGIIMLLLSLILVSVVVSNNFTSTPAWAAAMPTDDRLVAQPQPASLPPRQGEACFCGSDIYNCNNFRDQQDAQGCFDYCQSVGRGDVHGLDSDNDRLACEELPPGPTPAPTRPSATAYVDPHLNDPLFRSLSEADNLITNGNIEAGFYGAPELGFEPPESGAIPVNWNWYRNQTYGKYNIYGVEGFGLVCPDDFRLFTNSDFSLSLHMQSTDQPDARLGVYQTVNVVPGQQYLFAISGTIQAQPGASSPDVNNRVGVVFDHTGGSDWQAIPHDQWTSLPWREQELEFKLSGPDDPDLAKPESYLTIVKARSNRMTVFIEAWRRWPNWRTTIFTVDCISLTPLNQVDMNALLPGLARFSTSAVDAALKGSAGAAAPAAAPGAVPVTGQAEVIPAAETAIFPPAGGILDTKSNWILITVASIAVIAGLVGAGIWNARQRKE